jgi:hypothetical protein
MPFLLPSSGVVPYYQPGFYPRSFVAQNAGNQQRCVELVYAKPSAFNMDPGTSPCLKSPAPQMGQPQPAIIDQEQQPDPGKKSAAATVGGESRAMPTLISMCLLLLPYRFYYLYFVNHFYVNRIIFY